MYCRIWLCAGTISSCCLLCLCCSVVVLGGVVLPIMWWVGGFSHGFLVFVRVAFLYGPLRLISFGVLGCRVSCVSALLVWQHYSAGWGNVARDTSSRFNGLWGTSRLAW